MGWVHSVCVKKGTEILWGTTRVDCCINVNCSPNTTVLTHIIQLPFTQVGPSDLFWPVGCEQKRSVFGRSGASRKGGDSPRPAWPLPPLPLWEWKHLPHIPEASSQRRRRATPKPRGCHRETSSPKWPPPFKETLRESLSHWTLQNLLKSSHGGARCLGRNLGLQPKSIVWQPSC